jgi:molybdopterin converting factor subunit 1
MKIRFFAQSRQAAGCAECELSVDRPLDAADFWKQLIEKFPSLASLQKTARLARNETYLDAGEMLQPQDEVAVIPPVSGG